MEFVMKNYQYFPMSLIAFAFLSGCGTVQPKNSFLSEAHNSYDNARNNSQVTNLAALELKEAGDSLSKADIALSNGESAATVDHLAYIAKQQIGIAQETTKRKTAELAVASAGTKRDQLRLEARTAEADAAKRQGVIAQKTIDQQAIALADASESAKRDQASLIEITAEADSAQQQLQLVGKIADQQATELEAFDASTARDKVSLAAKDAALADAAANSARDQTLIAKQESQLKELNAKKTDRGMVITLGDVLFGTNKAVLKSGSMHSVQKLANFLKQYPKQRVLVEGYADSTGSDSHNQEISERRANAVRTALLDKGISSDRVTSHGYGKEFPVADNNNIANRQLNRRVEIILSDENGNISPR
jgi:outer membrane protein OmpA-like peptidoglycan-associated protein